jgi:putative endonuclease
MKSGSRKSGSKMSHSRQSLGHWGEAKAAEYLTSQGYEIIGCNVRTPYGEIDLVARQVDRPDLPRDPSPSTLVFIEVKTRASQRFGYPEVSVTPRKQAHMLASAQAYLQEHPELQSVWRIDVIAIQRFQMGEEVVIKHFVNAVTSCE